MKLSRAGIVSAPVGHSRSQQLPRNGESRRENRVIRVTRPIMLTVIMAVLLAWAGVVAAASPTETVQVAVKQVFPEQGKDAAQKVSTDQRRAQIRQVTESLFDFEAMSRISLGGYWTQVSPAEKEEFIRLFSNLVATSYMGKIEQYAGEPISLSASAWKAMPPSCNRG